MIKHRQWKKGGSMSFLWSAWWLWLVIAIVTGLCLTRYQSHINTLLITYAALGNAEGVLKLDRSTKWKIWVGTAITLIACVLFAVSMCICVGNILT